MSDRLLEPGDYQLISWLSIAARRRTAGLVTGEQRSPIQGGGIEFADYRDYQIGDDIRRIDWAVFLRLRRLLVKLCAEEKELTLMLLLDTSRSMRFGQPDKLRFAARIAAILAGVAMYDGNRAGVLAMGDRLRQILPPQRSRASITTAVTALSGLEPAVDVDPHTCVREFAARYGRRSMVVFFSDLLFPAWREVLTGLAASGCEGHVLQVMAPSEINPPYLGEVTLADVEGAGEVPLHMSADVSRRYRHELAFFLREVRQTARGRGLSHTLVSTDADLRRVFSLDLRRGGLVCRS